jgi:hypothetical protein
MPRLKELQAEINDAITNGTFVLDRITLAEEVR